MGNCFSPKDEREAPRFIGGEEQRRRLQSPKNATFSGEASPEKLAYREFEEWFVDLEVEVQDSIAMVLDVLEAQGAALGRPYVDTIKGSDFINMKELRVQHDGDPYRLLFAFDPNRQAVVLIGGNKRGDKRWYDVNIPIADRRFTEYLEETSGGEFL